MVSLLLFSEAWRGHLEQDLRVTQRSSFAESTLRNLSCQWNKFASFCQLSGNLELPISVHGLCLYIQYLSRSLVAPGSIHNYVSGLKTFHLFLDLPFPSLSELEVRLTLRGIKRLARHVPFKASPITPQLLRELLSLLNLDCQFDSVFWCLFSLSVASLSSCQIIVWFRH